MKKTIEKEKPKGRNGILLTIILATLFGLGAGIVSGLIIKPDILEDVYNIPFSGEIDLTQARLKKANLIIENAKKIIVEQDSKISETINSAQRSLVGIFEAKEESISTTSPDFNIDNYHRLDEKIAQGIIITSDGWILADNFKKGMSNNYLFENYVVIDRNNKIYNIDEIIEDKNFPYLFLHLKKVKELPVKNFAPKNTLTNGQIIIATDWEEKSYITNIISKKDDYGLLMSSDETVSDFILGDDLENYFKSAFIFNLNGEIIGLFNEKEGIIPIDYFQPMVGSLLSQKTIKRPALGINYINLSDFAILKEGFKKGALLYSDGKTPAIEEKSAAYEAGLKVGDIIISIDNIEINKDNLVADIIQKYSAGDEINIIFLRDEEEKITKATLKAYEDKID